MKSTLFTRGKTRRESPLPHPNVELSSSSSSSSRSGKKKTSRDNETPASVDDNDIYFDNTPPRSHRGGGVKKSVSMDDEGSRPPPTNPEAISLASSSFGLPRTRRASMGRGSSPPLQRTASNPSSRVPPKININTFWAANEEFERKYDLTPVQQQTNNGAVDVVGSASFTVDPWEHGGSSRRGTSSGR